MNLVSLWPYVSGYKHRWGNGSGEGPWDAWHKTRKMKIGDTQITYVFPENFKQNRNIPEIVKIRIGQNNGKISRGQI